MSWQGTEHVRLKTRWGTAGLAYREPAGWGAFPARWGAYLSRAGELMVKPLGPMKLRDVKAAVEFLGLIS